MILNLGMYVYSIFRCITRDFENNVKKNVQILQLRIFCTVFVQLRILQLHCTALCQNKDGMQ